MALAILPCRSRRFLRTDAHPVEFAPVFLGADVPGGARKGSIALDYAGRAMEAAPPSAASTAR